MSSSVHDYKDYKTPFYWKMRRHLVNWRARQDGSRDTRYQDWLDGIHPSLRRTAARVASDQVVRFHDVADALQSSQAFAFNLFLPFVDGPRGPLEKRLEEALGQGFRLTSISFEWVPPGGWLSEIPGEVPEGKEKITSVDVVLWGDAADGGSQALLVEVKFSEPGFSTCGGVESDYNRTEEICASARRLLADPASCYLRRPKRAVRDRRYWPIFVAAHGSLNAAFPGIDLDGHCPFAGRMNQPMRNLAIARALEQEGRVDRAWFMLCQHDDNLDVAAQWRQWRELLPLGVPAPLLLASEVVAAGREAGWADWAVWMSERYQLKG